MRYRVRRNVVVSHPDAQWLEAGHEYEGEVTPGWPKDPHEVRLEHPTRPGVYADVPITLLEELE
jgi:hypothetical protein